MDDAVAGREGEGQPVGRVERGLEQGGLGQDGAVQDVLVPGGHQVELAPHC